MNSTARVFLLGLLLACAPALQAVAEEEEGVFRSEELNFEIRLPPESIDWEFAELQEAETKMGFVKRLNTFWADSDPPAAADVYVFVRPLSKQEKREGLGLTARRFRSWEGICENPRNRKEEKGTLGGVEAIHVDVTGNHQMTGGIYRVMYSIAMNGKYLYAISIYRSYDAVDDEDLEEELQAIRDNFKFLEVRQVAAHKKGGAKAEEAPDAGGGGAGTTKDAEIPAEKLERRAIREDFWKFEAVKPQGLVQVPESAFSDAEKATGQKLKMERRMGQTYCMIRVNVASLKSGQRIYTVKQLADRYIKSFEKIYKKTMRKKPVIDKKWKLGKLSKKSMSLRLLGRRTVPEITLWYLADCKNDRQYQIQIYMTGATGEKAWKPQVEDFLANFKPFK